MSQHVTSPRVYLGIFAGLLVLTGVTVYTALSPIGALHTPVALGIAVAKAALVVLFFMHAFHSSKLTWVVIVVSLLMLGVMLFLTWIDYYSRGWLAM
jgi:cytochrome c oxidase subunit IV